MKRGTDIDAYLKPLSDKPIQAYLSNKFQIADIMEWCLRQIDDGVTIYQTSFSISDEYLRRLYHMRKTVKIKDLHIILDGKATNKTLTLWPFLRQTVEHVYLAENHSKIILIQSTNSDKSNVAIISSQNLTRGNRLESTIITTDRNVFSHLYGDVRDVIDHHSVCLSDIYQKRTHGTTNLYHHGS